MKKRIFTICLAVLLILALLPINALAEQMDTRSMAMTHKPGVVMVCTEWTASMTLYEFSIGDGLWDAVTDQVVQLIQQGKISIDDDNAITSAVMQLTILQMGDYAYYNGNKSTL